MTIFNQETLSTGCKSLDGLLGGGIRRGEVTLVYGEPGTGKTSLAIQCEFLCVKKGLKSIFIDSDNTFSLDRLAQIAGNELGQISPLIFVFKPKNLREQSLLVKNLESYTLFKMVLIVIDTITNLYRVELDPVDNNLVLNMELNWQLAYLNELAKTYNLSILLTSQVSSVIDGNFKESKIEPVARRILKFWAQKIISLKATSDPIIKEATLEKGYNKIPDKVNGFYMLSDRGIVSTC